MVLALPLVSKLVGVGLGPLLIVLVGFLSERTAFFLLWSADKTGSNSYTKIGENLFGWWGAKVVDLTILLQVSRLNHLAFFHLVTTAASFQNLGLCTSYVSLLGDFIPSIVRPTTSTPNGVKRHFMPPSLPQCHLASSMLGRIGLWESLIVKSL